MPLFLCICFSLLSYYLPFSHQKPLLSKQEPFLFCEQRWHHESRDDALHPAHPGQKDLPTSSSTGYPHKTVRPAWIWDSILTSDKGCPSFVILSIPLLLVTNNNGNSWSGKTWGFHHAIVRLKIKTNQKLTLLEAKNIMLALVSKKGIREVSPGLECFLADLQDSCVVPTGSCSRHKWGNLTAEDQITRSVP